MTPDTLRIGDAERNQVTDELKRHCTEGRLTLDEYSDRLDEVFAAKTYADLARSLRDLPGPAPRRPDRARPARPELAWGLPPFVKVMAIVLLVWALTRAGGFFFPAWPLIIVGIFIVRRSHHPRPLGRGPGGYDREVRV